MFKKLRLAIIFAIFAVILTSTLVFFPEKTITGGHIKTKSGVMIGSPVIPKEVPAEGLPSGGGGGGGVVPEAKSNFIVDKDLIKLLIKQGESKRKVVEIINTGDLVLDINLDIGSLKRFMIVSRESFSLEPGEVKIINLDIFAREDELPDAYTGRIVIQGDGITKIINVIIEIKEKEPMFDILTRIFDKELRPGDDVNANIKIINMGDLKPIDILLHYALKNFEGETLSYREESLAIDTELSIVRTLKLPESIPGGRYIFYSKVSYEDIVAASADVFEVREKKMELLAPVSKLLFNKITLLIIVTLIVIILVPFMRKRYIIWSITRKGYKRERESIKKLSFYINKCLARRIPENKIIKSLLRSGWDKKYVESILKKRKTKKRGKQ